MFKMKSLMRAAAAASAIGGVAAFAAPAGAVTVPQTVTGTAASQLTLTAGTPAAFTSFQAGSTGTSAGVLTATDTSPTWTLTVQDLANDGHMQAATGSTCAGSETELANPLQVTVGGLPASGATSAGQVPIPGKTATATTAASATNALLAATALTTTYSQAIGSSENLLAGCVYTLNATYTLQ